MAHGFLQKLDANLHVFSAGTTASGALNPLAVKAMKEINIDISHHTSDSVQNYLHTEWDYVITVCGGAHESCPSFTGKVKHRLHMGFDDPSFATGSEEYIWSEFVRVRDEICATFNRFYDAELRTQH